MIGGKLFKVGIEIGGKLDGSLLRSIQLAEAKVGGLGKAFDRAANAGRKGLMGTLANASFQASAAAAVGLTSAIGGAVKAAVEFDTAMAGVRKAITFADGTAGAKRFGKELIALSTTLPFTASELTEIAAAAGFAGYKESEIIPFTKAAARMGVAFQMTAGQAGEAMVALRAGMSLTQPQVETLGDAINYLSDTFQGTVNAADLTEVTRRIGAIGKASGLTAEQVAGLGAAFLASGTPTEIAATGLKNFLNALTGGENLAKPKQEALASILGTNAAVQSEIMSLSTRFDKGAGKLRKQLKDQRKEINQETAETIAEGMQVDPQGTIRKIIDGLAKMPKAVRPGVVSKLFGEESKAAIMPLLENPKLLGQAFDLVADKTAFAGSMQKEFQNQLSTTSAQWKIFGNGLTAIGISIGSALLPGLNKVMKVLNPALIKFSEWAQKNEALVTGLALVGGALVGLVAILPSIASTVAVLGSLGTTLAALQVGATIASSLGAIGPMLAILTGPIGLVALAVVGVGLAFVAAYKHVDWFRMGVDKWLVSFKTGWSGLMTAIGGAWEIFVGLLTFDGQKIKNGWQQLTEGMGRMWNGFTGTIAALFGTSIDRIQAVFDIFVGVFKLDADKIAGGWKRATDGFGPAFDRAMQRVKTAFGNLVKELGDNAAQQFANLGKTAGEKFVNGLTAAIRIGTGQGLLANLIERAARGAGVGVPSAPAPGTPKTRSANSDYAPVGTPTTRSSPSDYPTRQRALGGQVFRGLDYIVGERNEEVFRPPVSGRIFPSVEAADRADRAAMPPIANVADGQSPAAQIGSIFNSTVQPPAVNVTAGQPPAVNVTAGQPPAVNVTAGRDRTQRQRTGFGPALDAIQRLSDGLAQLLGRRSIATRAPSPRRALGGQVFRGVEYQVGERRSEVFRPNGAAQALQSVREAIPIAASVEAANRIMPSSLMGGGAGRLGMASPTATAISAMVEAPSPAVTPGPQVAPRGKQGLSGPLVVMQPGAVSVSVGSGDPGTVERAVAAALERFRYELESSYRSFLSD